MREELVELRPLRRVEDRTGWTRPQTCVRSAYGTNCQLPSRELRSRCLVCKSEAALAHLSFQAPPSAPCRTDPARTVLSHPSAMTVPNVPRVPLNAHSPPLTFYHLGS